MITISQYFNDKFDKAIAWRTAWNDLANNIELGRKKYPLQSQNEYFQYRAQLANRRVAVLMEAWDLHRPENKI